MAKPQWELYSDKDLMGGAQHWGISVEQERQHLRIVQSDFRQWPSGLRAFLNEKHTSGLEFMAFTQVQRSVVEWLKKGNSVSLNSAVGMEPVVALVEEAVPVAA